MTKAVFVLDLPSERLLRDGRPIPITNKAFQLLRLFAENPEHLLSKEQILEGLWDGVFVTDGLVREYVHDLRVALRDDPREPRYIETVPRRGYRFLGGIAIRDGREPPAVEIGSVGGRPILEVEAFEDIAGTQTSARLTNGLTDDLVTDLARKPDLVVGKAPNGPPRPGHSPVNLAPNYRLSGSVQISDQTVRANVRLLKIDTANHIWSERFDRPLVDLLQVQSDLTSTIISMIGGLSGPLSHSERLRLRRRPAADLRAYELYRLAFDLELTFDRDSVERARGLIDRAIKIDPDFARAWLVRGWIHWQLATEKWVPDTNICRRKMCAAYSRAARLDPRDQIAVMELAAAKAVEGDIAHASDALERSLDLGQRNADALISCSNYIASILDASDRARRILDTGLGLVSEFSPFHHLSILRVSFFAGDYDRGLTAAAQCPDLLQTRVFRALTLSELGREDEARAAARAVLDRTAKFGSIEYLSDHPIVGPVASEQFIAACDALGLPRG